MLLLTAILAVLSLGVSTANAANLRPIDCSETPFAFQDQSFAVDCEGSNDGMRVDDTTGKIKISIMTVSSNDRGSFFTMINQKITAPRVFLQHQSLSQSFKTVFSDMETSDWRNVEDKHGYDIVEFDTEISGTPSHCITVQRFTAAMFGGYKQHTIGVGCATGERNIVYDMLAKFETP